MDAAMFHDARAWERFTAIEARRIKQFLRLDEHPGLKGLEKGARPALLRPAQPLALRICERQLIYTMELCRVQAARARKGLPCTPARA